MFGRRRKILERGTQVHVFAPSPDCAAEFLAFTCANETFHQPWVYPATDATGFRNYLDRLENRNAHGFVVARNGDDAIVGVINVNDMVLGGFCTPPRSAITAAAFTRAADI